MVNMYKPLRKVRRLGMKKYSWGGKRAERGNLPILIWIHLLIDMGKIQLQRVGKQWMLAIYKLFCQEAV